MSILSFQELLNKSKTEKLTIFQIAEREEARLAEVDVTTIRKQVAQNLAAMRNAIYTKAVECGVEDLTQVVRIAISVAMRNVKLVGKDIVIGEANVDYYKPFLVQRIFEQEYEVLRTNQPMVKELTLVYVADGVSIAEGE